MNDSNSTTDNGNSDIGSTTTTTTKTTMEQGIDTKNQSDLASERSTREAIDEDKNDCSPDSIKKVATATATE